MNVTENLKFIFKKSTDMLIYYISEYITLSLR